MKLLLERLSESYGWREVRSRKLVLGHPHCSGLQVALANSGRLQVLDPLSLKVEDMLSVAGIEQSKEESTQVTQKGDILDHELHQGQHNPRIVSFRDWHKSKDLLSLSWRDIRVETVYRDEEEKNAREPK